MTKFCALLSKIKSVMNTSPLSAYEKDLGEHSCLSILLYRAAENSRERACAQSIIDIIRNESLTSEKKAEKLESFIDSYLNVYDDEGEEFKMNHAAFYDKMRRMADTIAHIQKEYGYGNTAVANYLMDKRNSGEWTNIDIEDERDKSLIRDLISITDYTADKDVLVNRCFNRLKSYLDNNTEKKEDITTSKKKMNHEAFCDKMKRIAEAMLEKQKNEGLTAAAVYLEDVKNNDFSNVDIEDEKDKYFLRDFLYTITYLSDSDEIVNHCLNKLADYLDDSTLMKRLTEAKTNTSHEEMIKLAKDIRSTLVMLRDANTSDDLIATNAFSIINNLKSKLPVADNNDDRFIKQMVDIAHNYSGQEMVYNMIASIDKWHMFKVEDPNLLSIDEFSKKISNKKKMDKDNVGYTILCEMKNLVEQTTTKLATNIEEEDFSNSLDKRLINRDLQSLLNSYSNILEVLGQYYVKLEK